MTGRLRHIEQYGYSDLPADGLHIRLLKLEPGEKEDYIHCHLEPVSLADARGTYECISYVWGTSTEIRRIIVDGHWFYVTLNLFHALQHFRSRTEERTIWADAICIQQTNPPEKGRQVQLMGKIYEYSMGTLVWLGMDTDRIATEATDFLKKTSKIAGDLCEKYGSVTQIPHLSKEDNPISQDAHDWELYTKFIAFKWFTRTWCASSKSGGGSAMEVMQEVGIAPNVSIFWLTDRRGDAEVKLSDVVNVNELQRHAPHIFGILNLSWFLHDAFLAVFMTYENEVSWRDQVVQDFLAQDRILVPQQCCIDTLIQSSRRDVTDERDHIYALLAHPLLQIEGDAIVQADYERNVNDVYLEVTAKVLEHVDVTMTLSIVGGMGERQQRDLDSNKPSWVIQWDYGHVYNLAIGRLEQWYYAGGKDTSVDLNVDTAATTLTLPAVIFDEIIWTSEPMKASELQIDQVIQGPSHRVAIDWVWDALPDEPCRYTGKFGSLDAFTLSLVCGAYKHRYPGENDMIRHRRLANAYRDYVKSFFGGGTGNESLRSDARDFENDIALLARERRFIVTKEGFYGLGPQLVQKGDVVAVIPGLRVPLALRPIPGDGTYKLVGAAYVHGVMRGEVLDEKDPLKLNAGRPKKIVIV